MTTSTFSWLDHSDRDRQRMLDAIDRFSEKDTRDELGLGSIRDGLSDLFFPGTNTIQTRARYFLFVPWIYRRLETGKGGTDNVAARARREELALCDALCRSEEVEGVIGARARGGLKRLPSNIYWLGLEKWGIRQFRGSQDDYHRRLKQPEKLVSIRSDDLDIVEGTGRASWHTGLPDPPKDLLEVADLRLTRGEAQYLRERIRDCAGNSLLWRLLASGERMQGDFPWQHPATTVLPLELADQLGHARLFSETMYGAALLYNLMLTEGLSPGEERDEILERRRAELADWCAQLSERADAIGAWDHDAFWRLARRHANVRDSTYRFVEAWWRLGTWRDAELAATSVPARELVRAREHALKKSRARIGNLRAMEGWNGAAGLARLNYRWGVTKRMVSDIQAGLARGGS